MLSPALFAGLRTSKHQRPSSPPQRDNITWLNLAETMRAAEAVVLNSPKFQSRCRSPRYWCR
jgi:hypothetical protein